MKEQGNEPRNDTEIATIAFLSSSPAMPDQEASQGSLPEPPIQATETRNPETPSIPEPIVYGDFNFTGGGATLAGLIAPDVQARLSSILDDQPAEADLLDYASYANALLELIINPGTKTPLTLGIFGRWGTGKTTLMRMLENGLQQAVATVWFNAWQYGKEDELWAAFLQSVLNKMEVELSFWNKLRFKTRLLFRRIEWRQMPGALLNYLLRAILVLLPLLLINQESGQLQPLGQALVNIGGTAVTLGLAAWIIVRPLLESIRQNVTIDFDSFRQESDYKKHIAFLDKFRDHFSDIVQSLPARTDKRLAVFIDDLDRCSQDRLLQVLDAVKLFIDIPGCVYVIGLDTEIVEKAVASKYKDDKTAQREYLSKIVQLPFQLPPLTRDELGDFLQNLNLDLPDPRCREVFIAGLVVNPREVKRTVNVFSLLWNLSSKRAELAGRIQPVLLAKVVVIQHGYPDLHKLLQQKPYYLIELETFFRQEDEQKLQGGSRFELPADSREQLDDILLRCGPFGSFDDLQAIFETESLLAWRDSLPYADSPEQLVVQTVDFLQNSVDKSGQSALLFFLRTISQGEEQESKCADELKLMTNLVNRKFHEQRINAPKELPLELQSFAKSESLRRMLLLFDLEELEENQADIVNVANLDPEEIAIYFTLTSRAEAPGQPDSNRPFQIMQVDLGERYRIEQELGRGGMGHVVLAYDSRQDQRVAIKILPPYLSADPDFRRRFGDEIRALYRLDHPNIVRIYDSGEYEGQLFFTMQYLSGGTLKDLLERKGALLVEEMAAIMLPILDALGFIHQQGYVHKDLKPASILFDARGLPKLNDFGISHTPFGVQTLTGAVAGTPSYMSPEQFEGKPVDGRSDLYSMGVTIYQCLSGQLPFEGDSLAHILMQHMTSPVPDLHTINADLPTEVGALVTKLMAKKPEDRYQTAVEVKADLLRIVNE